MWNATNKRAKITEVAQKVQLMWNEVNYWQLVKLCQITWKEDIIVRKFMRAHRPNRVIPA